MRMLTIALLCGCGIDPFETPSAYDQQRYLCDDEELDHLEDLEQQADACLAMPEEDNCTGVISFQGQVQQVQIRVDTMLQRSIVRMAQKGGDEVLSRVEISGAAPYFHFDTAISSIGAPWPDPQGETDFTVSFDSPEPDEAPKLEDGFGAVQWYIRAGSDTAMLTSNDHEQVPDGGTIHVSFLSDDRVDLWFGGRIGPAGDELHACAIVFRQPVPDQ